VKKILTLGITAVLLCAGLMVSVAAAAPKGIDDYNGFHYTLNLIGKKADFNGVGGGGSTMFVPESTAGMNFTLLDGTVLDGIRIDVENTGTDYEVTDGNACDGTGSFILPEGKYAVYITVKGKPNEAAYTNITGWMQYVNDTDKSVYYYLDVGTVSVKRSKEWTDASDIFYITEDEVIDHNTKVDDLGQLLYPENTKEMWIFDYMGWLGENGFSELDYFWQLENSGNKLIKLRFYPV